MTLNPQTLRQLARVIVATRPDEVDCDEWLARVGRMAELEHAGTPLPPDLAPVRQHIDVCPECLEEFKGLLLALEDEG